MIVDLNYQVSNFLVDLVGQLYNLPERIQNIINLQSEPDAEQLTDRLKKPFERRAAPNASKYHA